MTPSGRREGVTPEDIIGWFRTLACVQLMGKPLYMMLDADIVAVSPSSVYRVLEVAGKLAPAGGTAVQARGKASSNPCGLTSTGTSTSPTSTSAGPSSSSAPSSTATAASSCTGRSARP